MVASAFNAGLATKLHIFLQNLETFWIFPDAFFTSCNPQIFPFPGYYLVIVEHSIDLVYFFCKFE